jgi:hypothetical protein
MLDIEATEQSVILQTFRADYTCLIACAYSAHIHALLMHIVLQQPVYIF